MPLQRGEETERVLGLQNTVAVVRIPGALKMGEQLKLAEQVGASIRQRHVPLARMTPSRPTCASVERIKCG